MRRFQMPIPRSSGAWICCRRTWPACALLIDLVPSCLMTIYRSTSRAPKFGESVKEDITEKKALLEALVFTYFILVIIQFIWYEFVQEKRASLQKEIDSNKALRNQNSAKSRNQSNPQSQLTSSDSMLPAHCFEISSCKNCDRWRVELSMTVRVPARILSEPWNHLRWRRPKQLRNSWMDLEETLAI